MGLNHGWLGVVAAVTGVNAVLLRWLGYQSLALVYLLSVVILAMFVGRGPTLVAATATQHDKARAEEDLRKFYTDVLPGGLAGARRATYLHLTQLARDAGLQYQRRQEESQEPRPGGEGEGSALARFDITMVLEGDYEGVRQFLREVEASDGFIVIDNIGLAEGPERGVLLVLTVELSTYYRAATRGS